MTSQTEIPTLASLEFLPYLNDQGQLPDELQGKVGVYAIFDHTKALQFIGFSRDIFLSLKQHLVRQLDRCYWIKVKTIDRPNRTVLEEIRAAWIQENGSAPLGNTTDEAKWNQPIDVKAFMTPAEQSNYDNPVNDEVAQGKILKNVARRVEAEILAQLKERGVQAEIRFNPKIKEEGLLDLK
jgi:hypothetical protein